MCTCTNQSTISFLCYRHSTSCLFLFLLSCCGVKKHTKALMGINYLPTTSVSGVQIAVKTVVYNAIQPLLTTFSCNQWLAPLVTFQSDTSPQRQGKVVKKNTCSLSLKMTHVDLKKRHPSSYITYVCFPRKKLPSLNKYFSASTERKTLKSRSFKKGA